MRPAHVDVKSILTRTSGYLRGVASHSLQPYRGCTFGRSLCGVACYVQHNQWLTKGQPWGKFLDARVNAAAKYRDGYDRERRWARAQARSRHRFSIFMSSSTDPFLPQERRLGITRAVLETMIELPPDALILQTHSPRVADHVDVYTELRARSDLRVHISIESDRDRLLGLPPPVATVADRFGAAAKLKEVGIPVIVTVSPLLPIESPESFFRRISEVADGAVIDHFIGGDGSPDGMRTKATRLPEIMEKVLPGSTTLSYRDEIVARAREILPGRVGVGASGFAGELS